MAEHGAHARLLHRTMRDSRLTRSRRHGRGLIARAMGASAASSPSKCCRPTQVDLDRRQRFVQEAQAASALNHPNIVHIYGIESDTGQDCIVMEYVDGRTLDDAMRAKRLTIREALDYALQIADALASAHAAGIVHRDVRPGNIMVTAKGLVKVLDFGVAKLVADPDPQNTTRTMAPKTSSSGPRRTCRPNRRRGGRSMREAISFRSASSSTKC